VGRGRKRKGKQGGSGQNASGQSTSGRSTSGQGSSGQGASGQGSSGRRGVGQDRGNLQDWENLPGGTMDPSAGVQLVALPDSGSRDTWNPVSNGIKPRKRGERSEWAQEIDRLTGLGQILDRVTPEKCWKKNEVTGEIWKPTFRDQWIETKLKIRTKLGGNHPFELNPVQREYSRVCLETGSKLNIVLKARQVGITSYIAARFFVETVTHKGALTMLVAQDRVAAEEIFRIVHRFWDNLPADIQGALKTSHASARELVFPGLDSEFTVASADENAGRGRTIQNLHCTEVSRWGREGLEALASLRAAVVPGGEIVLESTGNGAWGSFYQEWQQAGETGYRQHFFPWWFESSYKSEPGASFEMTEEETALAKLHGLKPEQIAWRRRQWRSLRGLAAQEFAEDAVSCFRASGDCVFELEVVEKALAALERPVEARDNGRLLIWLPPRAGREYVIGVDPAGGGLDGDYSCAQVIDRKSGTQCAELQGHYPLREFSEMLITLGREYNSAELAVERNNHGHAVLALLEHKGYTNLFRKDGSAGWNTTAQSRPRMIADMMAVVGEIPELFRSERLWNECRTFVRLANGVPGAAAGAHDDCVMAMGIALAARNEGASQKLEVRLKKGKSEVRTRIEEGQVRSLNSD